MDKTPNEIAICFVKDRNNLWFYYYMLMRNWQMRPSIRCIEWDEMRVPPYVFVTYVISGSKTLNQIVTYFDNLKKYWTDTPEDKKSLELFSQSEMKVKILSNK